MCPSPSEVRGFECAPPHLRSEVLPGFFCILHPYHPVLGLHREFKSQKENFGLVRFSFFMNYFDISGVLVFLEIGKWNYSIH